MMTMMMMAIVGDKQLVTKSFDEVDDDDVDGNGDL